MHSGNAPRASVHDISVTLRRFKHVETARAGEAACRGKSGLVAKPGDGPAWGPGRERAGLTAPQRFRTSPVASGASKTPIRHLAGPRRPGAAGCVGSGTQRGENRTLRGDRSETWPPHSHRGAKPESPSARGGGQAHPPRHGRETPPFFGDDSGMGCSVTGPTRVLRPLCGGRSQPALVALDDQDPALFHGELSFCPAVPVTGLRQPIGPGGPLCHPRERACVRMKATDRKRLRAPGYCVTEAFPFQSQEPTDLCHSQSPLSLSAERLLSVSFTEDTDILEPGCPTSLC